jgi:hypothetical protein
MVCTDHEIMSRDSQLEAWILKYLSFLTENCNKWENCTNVINILESIAIDQGFLESDRHIDSYDFSYMHIYWLMVEVEPWEQISLNTQNPRLG